MRIEVNPNSIDDEIMGPDPDPPRPPERTKKLTIGRKKPPSRPPSCLSGVSGFVSAPSVSLLSASPRSGPRRYLTINQDCSAALLEGEEMSRKPRLVMKGLQPQSRIVLPPSPNKPVQQISRTHSPGKAQHQPPVSLSPMAQRLATSHNVIREDFSPSPVVPKNPKISVVRNVFGNTEQDSCLKKTPVVNLPRLSKQELINKAAKISKTAEEQESPDDNRLSISFQPTPARLRFTAGETEAVEVDAEKDAPLPPTSENTFKIPSVPVPVPSASSQFKAPLPVPAKEKRLKGDVEPASNTGLVTETEHASTEVRYLHSWVPRLKNGKVYVEGDLLDLDTSKDLSSELSRRYMTSRIVRRVNNVTIGTKKTLYVLEGELLLRDFDTSRIGQTPFFILDKFKHGFPANWEKLLKHWVRMETQNSKNSAYMSFISSTVLSNYSTLGNNSQANFSNISAITTMNTSGWVKQRMANLSVNRQSEITVIPSEATLFAGDDEVIPRHTEGLEHEVQDAVTIVEKQDYLAPIEEAEEEKDDNTTPSDAEVSLKEKTVKHKSDGKRKLKSGNSLNSTLTRRNYATSKNIVEELSSTNKSEIVGLNGSFSPNDNYYCNECKFSTNSQKKMYDHCDLLIHKKKTRDIVKSRSKEKFMGCRGCGFSAHRNDDLFRHYGTKKHGKLEVQLKKERKEEVFHTKPLGLNSKATKNIPKTGSDGEEMVEEMIDEPSPKKSKSRKNGKENPEIEGDNSEEELKRKTNATAVKRKSGSSREVVTKKVKKSNIKPAPADRSCGEEMDNESPPKKSKSRKKSSNGKVNPEIEGDNSEEELKRKSRATAVKRKSGSAKEVVTKKVKKSNIEPAPAVSNPDHESTVNQSMFGRQRKINRRYLRQSCVYNTPEEADPPKKSNKSKKTSTGDKENMTDDEMTEYEELNDLSSKKKEKAKKGSGIKKAKAGAAPKKATASEKPKKTEESLRRVVLNPFKKPSEEVVNEPAKPSKDVGDILKKVSAKPKTVKQRIQNVEALKEYNENHEDDMFNEPAPNSKSSMKISSLATLLSQDPDSDSDNDISVHSARTPVTGENI